MLFFNHAQTFYLDKTAVKNAAEVALTRVDLYFRAKPPAIDNKSGIENPGVEVRIVPTLNGIPVINQMGAYRPTEPTEHGAKFAFYSGGETARVEYDNIQASTNASIPTAFLFDNPIFVSTDKEYAIIVKFDGSENFILWKNVIGQNLVGTSTPSSGASGRFTGTLFSFIDDPNRQDTMFEESGYGYSGSNVSSSVANSLALIYGADVTTFEGNDTNYLNSNWTPVPDQNLKFKVYVGRYSKNGVPVISLPEYTSNLEITTIIDRPTAIHGVEGSVLSNNVIRLAAPVQTTEYIIFESENSTKDDLFYGEPFYQVGPYYPGGKASPLTVSCFPNITGANVDYTAKLIQANGSYVLANGSTFNDVGGFTGIVEVGDLLVVIDGANTHLVQVDSINSNTEIIVDPPFDATIASANFIIAPIGYLNDISQTTIFGRLNDLATFYNSTANSTVRFVSHAIANSTINDGGTGYSNNDYIKVTGYEDIDYSVKGNYPALANVVTDANGTITNIYFSNVGAGFNNASAIVVTLYQSTSGVASEDASNGESANLSFTIGSSIKSAFKTTNFANCQIVNLEVIRMKPEITVNNPLGSSFLINHRTLYHSIPDANTFTGKAYYIDTPAETANTDTYSKIFKTVTLNIPDEGKTPVLMSRSNEFSTRYANGALNANSEIYGDVFSNTASFLFDISSNNDFQAIFFDPEIVNSHYAKYIVNKDYTNEHTNYGNAFSKHIGTKVNLAGGRSAEDVLVYITAYRPANTDIKIYARLQKAEDEDAFDDLDWSKLELINGVGVYSSKEDSSDYIELTYGLPAYPNSDFTLNGTVSLTQGNLHIIGTGTTFEPTTTINAGGTGYVNGDIVEFTAGNTVYNDGYVTAAKISVNAQFTVGTDGSGVITSLTAVDLGYGWSNQSTVDSFSVTHANGDTSVGTGANLYFTAGLQANDMVKIYSPYTDFANVNYTIAIVDEVVSNTNVKIKQTLGIVAANSVGNVSINTTSTQLDGIDTDFTGLSNGDFIIIWANSSVYETRKVVSVTDANTLVMDANGTYTNTATKYAVVTPDAFMNLSLNVDGLKIDRIAYPHQAFNFAQEDNVCRYYNTSMVEFDTYDTMQIKVVLLSDNDIKVPKVDDIRGICVTA